MFTQTQIDEIIVYGIAQNRLLEAQQQGKSTIVRQQWLKQCIGYLNVAGVSPEEADAYIASRRWFRECGMFVDLDEPGAPLEAQLKAYCALSTAAEKIGDHNYRTGIYQARKFQPGKPLTYRVTNEHQAVIDAMSKVLEGSMSPEEAMALLYKDDVMKQRISDE